MTTTTVQVHTWFPEPMPDRSAQQPVDDTNDHIVTRVWNGTIRIWGRLHQQNSTHSWWRSSSIVRAVSPTTFITRHGTLVSVVGPMYTPYARKFYLSDQTLAAFRNGLPQDWISQLCKEPHPFYSASPFVINHTLQQLDEESMSAPPPIKPTENVPPEPSSEQLKLGGSPPRVTASKSCPNRVSRRVSFSEPVAIVSERPARTRRNSVPKVLSNPADVVSAVQVDSAPKQPPGPMNSMRRGKPKALLRPIALQADACKKKASPGNSDAPSCLLRPTSESPQLKSEQDLPIQKDPSKATKNSAGKAVARKIYPRRAASLAAKSKIKQTVLHQKMKSPSRRRTTSLEYSSGGKQSKTRVPVIEISDDETVLDKKISDARPQETQNSVNVVTKEKKEGHVDKSHGTNHNQKRVAFANIAPDDNSPPCQTIEAAASSEQPEKSEDEAGQWSREQREAFQRQRNQIAANLPDYWERVAAGVPEKSAEDCRSLWMSNWTSPLPNVTSRKKRRVATPEVVMHVRKASKQKQSRETAIYRSNVRRLAEVVARDVNDAVLEPRIVTPTSLPGAKQLLELAADDDGDGSYVMMDGTPGSEIRQRRADITRKGELATPEILARGKKLGFQESDHYVTLFKKRIGSAALCMPVTSEDSAKVHSGTALSRGKKLGVLGKRSRVENMSDYDSKDTNETANSDDDYGSNDESEEEEGVVSNIATEFD